LDRWKRIDRLIEAVPDLIALYPNVLVLIVGDGIERDNLVRLSSTLGVGNYVKFTGAVPHTNVTDYMHAADVFVSTQDATNFGNHLLEAMVCGRCIVTLNNGDTGNFITNNDNGILLEPDDLRSLPTAIAKLLHDDVLRKQLGDGALRYARQNFQTWDERMRTEVKLIEDLVGRAPGLA
jgi:glycosyltransferase involved in cell wall biosynthesis